MSAETPSAPALLGGAAEMGQILENTDLIWRQTRDSVRSLQKLLMESNLGQSIAAPSQDQKVRERSVTFDSTLDADQDKEQSRSRVASRRSSAFSSHELTSVGDACQALGGQVVTLDTGSSLSGTLEAVLLDPPGKQLAPGQFVSTGLVVCLQSMPMEAEVLDEWCNAVRSTNWLNDGVSVIIPNIQMSSALAPSDMEAIVEGAMRLAHFESCLLMGKDWGAVRAVELAAEGSVADKIEGVILVGPTSPVPLCCHEIDVPVLLVWAEDDDVSPFEDRLCWLDALDSRCATHQFCAAGAHQLDRIMESHGVSVAVRKFAAAAFLMAEVGNAEAEDLEGEAQQKSSERIQRLSVCLPSFLSQNPEQLLRLTEEEESAPRRKNSAKSPAQRMALDLPQWLSAGMVSSSE